MLQNITNKSIISKEINYAAGLADNIFGMILKKNSNGLILHTRFGVHTFFMKNSIDILILDKNKICINIQENLKPNNIYLWSPKYETVIELPAGSVRKGNISRGDKLDF